MKEVSQVEKNPERSSITSNSQAENVLMGRRMKEGARGQVFCERRLSPEEKTVEISSIKQNVNLASGNH